MIKRQLPANEKEEAECLKNQETEAKVAKEGTEKVIEIRCLS